MIISALEYFRSDLSNVQPAKNLKILKINIEFAKIFEILSLEKWSDKN